MHITRRKLFLSATSLAALSLGSGLLRPHNNGHNYTPYFMRLNQELQKNRQAYPQLIIDKQKLNANIGELNKLLPHSSQRRIVTKSLPSVNLLQYICTLAETQKLMVFHLPFLLEVSKAMPQSDILLGKPLPALAVEQFYREKTPLFNASQQLQWLVDSNTRLLAYLEVAKRNKQNLKINLEIDVGLHRGGFTQQSDFVAALEVIKNNPHFLTLGGLMGYDAHVGKLPSLIQSGQKTHRLSQLTYQTFINTLESTLGINSQALCLNGAGSGTLAYHTQQSVCNDFSAGSCLIKPSDFDLSTLHSFQAAAFIATPVLKKQNGLILPGAEFLKNAWQIADPNQAQSFFIYGGNWKANPYSPQGLQRNTLYGNSSNQELLTGSNSINLAIGDTVFLRPQQSEQVLLQFGDLWLFDTKKNGHAFRWENMPVLSNNS